MKKKANERIINAILEALELTLYELRERNRTQIRSEKRLKFYYFCAEHGLTYYDIEDVVERGSASVYRGKKRVKEYVSVCPSYAKEVEELRIKISNKLN